MPFDNSYDDFDPDKVLEEADSMSLRDSVLYLRNYLNELDYFLQDEIKADPEIEAKIENSKRVKIRKLLAIIEKELRYRKKKYEIEKNFESGYSEDQLIHWTGTERQILEVFNFLIKKGCITLPPPLSAPYKLIASHFKNKKGKRFKEGQLSTVEQIYTTSSELEKEINDNIVSKVES